MYSFFLAWMPDEHQVTDVAATEGNGATTKVPAAKKRAFRDVQGTRKRSRADRADKGLSRQTSTPPNSTSPEQSIQALDAGTSKGSPRGTTARAREERTRPASGEGQVRQASGEERAPPSGEEPVRLVSGEEPVRPVSGEEPVRPASGEEQARPASGEGQARPVSGEGQQLTTARRRTESEMSSVRGGSNAQSTSRVDSLEPLLTEWEVCFQKFPFFKKVAKLRFAQFANII